jgi:biotin transporter BioY
MLGPLILGLATGEARSVARRLRRAAIAYLAAAVLGLVGLVFLLLAAWIFLARRVGPMEAALWFAGVFIVLAAVVLIIHRVIAAARRRSAARQRTRDLTSVGASTALVAVPLLSRTRGGIGALAVGVALLGGYAIYSLWSGGGDKSAFSRSRRRRR